MESLKCSSCGFTFDQADAMIKACKEQIESSPYLNYAESKYNFNVDHDCQKCGEAIGKSVVVIQIDLFVTG